MRIEVLVAVALVTLHVSSCLSCNRWPAKAVRRASTHKDSSEEVLSWPCLPLSELIRMAAFSQFAWLHFVLAHLLLHLVDLMLRFKRASCSEQRPSTTLLDGNTN